MTRRLKMSACPKSSECDPGAQRDTIAGTANYGKSQELPTNKLCICTPESRKRLPRQASLTTVRPTLLTHHSRSPLSKRNTQVQKEKRFSLSIQ